MSYEGFDQYICEKGHYFTLDAMESYGSSIDEIKCPKCESKAAWWNPVDETNCEGVGFIPLGVLREKFLVKGAEECICPTCGHSHYVGEDIFRVPTQEETRSLRTIRNPSDPNDIRLLDDAEDW